jgi:undecaprenyl-diphosphatase
VIEAIVWGLVQGLTEFLPISSSGHLVLIPDLLGTAPPSLAASAVLHLGTLAAVIAYYRRDLLGLASFRQDPIARRTLILLGVGSLPAGIGFFLRSSIETLQASTTAVSVALIVTGLVLWFSDRFALGNRMIASLRWPDAVVIGLGQAVALIPGISRSGMTIAAGVGRSMERSEAARFSFLLGIPAIAAAGTLELVDLAGSGTGVAGSLWVGVAMAAVSGYAAIAILLRIFVRRGMAPFALYAVFAGIVGLVVL